MPRSHGPPFSYHVLRGYWKLGPMLSIVSFVYDDASLMVRGHTEWDVSCTLPKASPLTSTSNWLTTWLVLTKWIVRCATQKAWRDHMAVHKLPDRETLQLCGQNHILRAAEAPSPSSISTRVQTACRGLRLYLEDEEVIFKSRGSTDPPRWLSPHCPHEDRFG